MYPFDVFLHSIPRLHSPYCTRNIQLYSLLITVPIIKQLIVCVLYGFGKRYLMCTGR